MNYRSQSIRRLWQRVQYSLTHPGGPAISSGAEKNEGIRFLQLMKAEWTIENQAFFAHGHLNFKQLRAGYELAAIFGFGSLWQYEGNDIMTFKDTLLHQRINLAHLLSYIVPPIYNRPLTDAEFWNAINNALHKSLGLRLLSNATKLRASWPTKFGYVILQPEAFQLSKHLNLVMPNSIKELHFPVIMI